MLEPETSLAFSIQSQKGVYALLLGSGISRSAQIPTGWEITLELIRRVAAARGVKEEIEPVDWYLKNFEKAPNYSEVLNLLGGSAAERQNIIRSFMEPSADELSRGIKAPSKAHRSIARLIANGYFRIVITTNFDRLLEDALNAESVHPYVIASTDAIRGMPPLVHLDRCIIKLHGDYLDSRIRNTDAELSQYDNEMNDLLDRILDEFGLVVCGWSGEWDHALVSAIESCRNRRFNTFWAVHGKMSDTAARIAKQRAATVFPITAADDLWQSIESKVFNIAAFNRQHPLSTKLSVETLKKYLLEPRHEIDLHDLVMEHVNSVVLWLREKKIPATPQAMDLKTALEQMTGRTETLRALFSTGGTWATQSNTAVWIEALVALTKWTPGASHVQLYPALLALYSFGISAIRRNRYDTFAKMLISDLRMRGGGAKKIVNILNSHSVLEKGLMDTFYLSDDGKRYKTPGSSYLESVFQTDLKSSFVDEREFQDHFTRFEYLAALLFAEVNCPDLKQRCWAPPGSFVWRETAESEVDKEIDREGEHWPLLNLGYFSGSMDRLNEIRRGLHEQAERIRWL